MNQIIPIIITLVLVAIVTIVVIIIYFQRKFKEMEERRAGDQGLQMLNQNIQSLQSNFSEKIDRTNQAINERLDNAARVISAVTHELGQMQQIGSQLANFQDFLKSPKLRGGLGEQGLKDMLSNALPASYYAMQFAFRDGTAVDAIINLDAGKIPIDAKFPLENFNKLIKASQEDEKNAFRRAFRNDFRKHVNAIASKYIKTDEGTAEFAFMYIPSESVFFEIVNNEQDLFEYAAKSHVIPSSPSTFFYYLRTIMLGLEGKRITQMSREILKMLRVIQSESKNFGDDLGVLNRHISNASKSMDTVYRGYDKLSSKIEQTSMLESKQAELVEDIDKDDQKFE